jgi:hypothetical protein
MVHLVMVIRSSQSGSQLVSQLVSQSVSARVMCSAVLSSAAQGRAGQGRAAQRSAAQRSGYCGTCAGSFCASKLRACVHLYPRKVLLLTADCPCSALIRVPEHLRHHGHARIFPRSVKPVAGPIAP